jgi:hypothetical protein
MRSISILVLALATGCAGSEVSRTIGARCDDSSECDDRCLAPSVEYPGGMCSVSCDDDGACPGDTRCVADDGGVCLYSCTVDRDCRFLGLDWTCQARDDRAGGQVMVCRG